MSKEHILCAAIHYKDGETYHAQPDNIEEGFVLSGYRHGHIITLAAELLHIPTQKNARQGFLTNHDRFVGREEAAQIAKDAKQLIEPYDEYKPVLLFSEHIY